jgi:hypothetical protein
VKRIANRFNRIWGKFELELQEMLNTPNNRRDGLSFNQGGKRPVDVESNTLTLKERRHAPAAVSPTTESPCWEARSILAPYSLSA